MSNKKKMMISLLIAALAALAAPVATQAGPSSAAKLDGAMRRHVGQSLAAVRSSARVRLKIPSIAESGANVPVTVISSIPVEQAEAVYIFVDKNPNPYIAGMKVYPLSGKVAFGTRIKMGATSRVRGVVKLKNGQAVQAFRDVKVTVGGCGG